VKEGREEEIFKSYSQSTEQKEKLIGLRKTKLSGKGYVWGSGGDDD